MIDNPGMEHTQLSKLQHITSISDPGSIKSASQCKRTKRRTSGPDRILPVDFRLCDYSVVIGRGQKPALTTGNCRLRVLTSTFLPQYADATESKSTKTYLVNKIVNIIKSACHDLECEAAFVRYKNGRWYEVDDSVAREKVGYQFRDLLADRYESSSKRKVERKHERKRARQAAQRKRMRLQEERTLSFLENYHGEGPTYQTNEGNSNAVTDDDEVSRNSSKSSTSGPTQSPVDDVPPIPAQYPVSRQSLLCPEQLLTQPLIEDYEEDSHRKLLDDDDLEQTLFHLRFF